MSAFLDNEMYDGTGLMFPMLSPGWSDLSQMPEMPTGQPSRPIPTPTQRPMPRPTPTQPTPPSGEPTPITLQSSEYLAGYLQTQIGKLMRVEFLMSNGPLVDRIGTLLRVGASYIVLRPVGSNDTVVCDLYSIKFVTIYSSPQPTLYGR